MFVDLAQLPIPAWCPPAASALGLIDRPGSSTFGTLSHAIGNCHVVLATVSTCWMRAPGATVVELRVPARS